MRKVQKRGPGIVKDRAYHEEGLDRVSGGRPIWQPQFGETRFGYLKAWLRWKRGKFA
jgi:hypothetical protein